MLLLGVIDSIKYFAIFYILYIHCPHVIRILA